MMNREGIFVSFFLSYLRHCRNNDYDLRVGKLRPAVNDSPKISLQVCCD